MPVGVGVGVGLALVPPSGSGSGLSPSARCSPAPTIIRITTRTATTVTRPPQLTIRQRHKPLLSEKLAHQSQRRPAVAATLDQHVKDLAFVVDGTPEIHPLARDTNNHLVQMPSITRAGTAPP